MIVMAVIIMGVKGRDHVEDIKNSISSVIRYLHKGVDPYNPCIIGTSFIFAISSSLLTYISFIFYVIEYRRVSFMSLYRAQAVWLQYWHRQCLAWILRFSLGSADNQIVTKSTNVYSVCAMKCVSSHSLDDILNLPSRATGTPKSWKWDKMSTTSCELYGCISSTILSL